MRDKCSAEKEYDSYRRDVASFLKDFVVVCYTSLLSWGRKEARANGTLSCKPVVNNVDHHRRVDVDRG